MIQIYPIKTVMLTQCNESDDDIESDDDDRFSFTDDSSDNEEEELEGKFPEECNPEGVESDDDESGCCHWSKIKHFDMNRKIQADAASPEYGKPSSSIDRDSRPHDLVELVINDTFLDLCIDATNEHAVNDDSFRKNIGIIEKNEKGRALLKGFLAVKWHLALLGYRQKEWAWSEDSLKKQPEIKKIMTYRQFKLMLKHFKVTKPSDMPAKYNENYHPLQNILSGVNFLKNKSISLWIPGRHMCLDEGRITSKSRRNIYKTRNPDKPIRMGWTVNKLADKGELGGYFVYNHLTKVGKYSYTDLSKGKNYNIVDQLISEVKGLGKTVVMDSGFPTVSLVKDAKQEWNTAIISTPRGNVAHLPSKHGIFKNRCKSFIRGYSESLHHGEGITLTYWNDNNAVCFLNNNVESGEENWSLIETNNKGGRSIVHIPKVAAIYRETYGWVDRTNQDLAYYNTEHRTVRKQSRVLDSMIEIYALNNMYAVWQNSPHLAEFESVSCTADFRFAVVKVWYAISKKLGGRPHVLNYPRALRKSGCKRQLEDTVLSPVKVSVLKNILH